MASFIDPMKRGLKLKFLADSNGLVGTASFIDPMKRGLKLENFQRVCCCRNCQRFIH
jgi:hypothetical protein